MNAKLNLTSILFMFCCSRLFLGCNNRAQNEDRPTIVGKVKELTQTDKRGIGLKRVFRIQLGGISSPITGSLLTIHDKGVTASTTLGMSGINLDAILVSKENCETMDCLNQVESESKSHRIEVVYFRQGAIEGLSKNRTNVRLTGTTEAGTVSDTSASLEIVDAVDGGNMGFLSFGAKGSLTVLLPADVTDGFFVYFVLVHPRDGYERTDKWDLESSAKISVDALGKDPNFASEEDLRITSARKVFRNCDRIRIYTGIIEHHDLRGGNGLMENPVYRAFLQLGDTIPVSCYYSYEDPYCVYSDMNELRINELKTGDSDSTCTKAAIEKQMCREQMRIALRITGKIGSDIETYKQMGSIWGCQ